MKYDIVIKGSRVLIRGAMRPGWIALRENQMIANGTGRPPACREAVDAGADCVGPALVDTHIHGFGGIDASDCADPERGKQRLHTMAAALMGAGVGAFCPTLYPLSNAATLACLNNIREARDEQRKSRVTNEARILGAHLEGPFVNPARPGALDIEKLQKPDLKCLRRWIDTGAVSIITIAPELEGASAIIRECKQSGVVVSMGHSAASMQQCRRAESMGASSITHVMNAMAPPHHRNATIANFALTADGFGTELIPDLEHVSPAGIDLIFRARGIEGIRLVSDNLAAAGTRRRRFTGGGSDLVVKNGIAHRADGGIAGSCIPLIESVGRLARTGLISLEEAWRLASEEPTKLVKPDAVHGYARLVTADGRE